MDHVVLVVILSVGEYIYFQLFFLLYFYFEVVIVEGGIESTLWTISHPS